MQEKLRYSRRSFVKGAAVLGLSFATLGASETLAGCAGSGDGAASVAASNGTKTFVYTGCWDEKGGEKGLWVHTFDEATGEMTDAKRVTDEISVGFICIDYDKSLLYVTDECDVPFDKDAGMGAGGGGRIWVYEVDPLTGDLTERQCAPSFGSNPSMVSIDPTGKHLLCSIHTAKPCPCKIVQDDLGSWQIAPACPSANCVVFELNEDGTIGEVRDIMAFRGEAHLSQLHTVTWAPNGKFFVVADKGTGDIYSMVLDSEGKLELASTVSLGKGYSPRYVRFHPEKPWMYCNFESANEVVAFSFDEKGVLERTGAGAVVPEEWLARVPEKDGKYEQQDMKMTEDGSYLYTVFRGSSDNLVGKERVHGDGGFQGVAVLKIDQDTGIPDNVQALELDCAWPRGCALSPDEKHLVVSCLYSDEMIALPINADGTLSADAVAVEQTTAANVTFFRAPAA